MIACTRPVAFSNTMNKDDMAIPSSIPDTVIRAALETLRGEFSEDDVTWDVPRRKGNRPTRVYFEARDLALLRRAKDRVEALLAAAGHALY